MPFGTCFTPRLVFGIPQSLLFWIVPECFLITRLVVSWYIYIPGFDHINKFITVKNDMMTHPKLALSRTRSWHQLSSGITRYDVMTAEKKSSKTVKNVINHMITSPKLALSRGHAQRAPSARSWHQLSPGVTSYDVMTARNSSKTCQNGE